MIVDVTEEELSSITQSILKRYGIDFTCYEPKSLRRRIIRILNKFELASIHDLWMHFLKTPNFISVFMNEISVGMTSMFRDPVLWKQMKLKVEVEFMHKPLFSVWHAGCSTGEEVYSFGILLDQLKLAARVNALATDFNRDAITEAKAGVYHKIKMIENETNYRTYSSKTDFDKYYTTDGKEAVMNSSLINHVKFEYHNLITDSFKSGFDIIFCRNVMIYFDALAKTRILDKFYDSLNEGGYFVIGFFDTMSHLIDNRKFKIVDEQAKIFQKI